MCQQIEDALLKRLRRALAFEQQAICFLVPIQIFRIQLNVFNVRVLALVFEVE